MEKNEMSAPMNDPLMQDLDITTQKNGVLPKIFYGTLCVGILFALVLLALLLGQPANADAVPQKNGWIVVSFFLFFQAGLYVFSLLFPLCINHAYRAEVWKNSAFLKMFPFFSLSRVMQSEEKMRNLRETILFLFWFMDIVMMIFLIAMQWLWAVEQGVLPALFSKSVGEGLLLVGFIVCFGIVAVKMYIAIFRFRKPDQREINSDTKSLNP